MWEMGIRARKAVAGTALSLPGYLSRVLQEVAFSSYEPTDKGFWGKSGECQSAWGYCVASQQDLAVLVARGPERVRFQTNPVDDTPIKAAMNTLLACGILTGGSCRLGIRANNRRSWRKVYEINSVLAAQHPDWIADVAPALHQLMREPQSMDRTRAIRSLVMTKVPMDVFGTPEAREVVLAYVCDPVHNPFPYNDVLVSATAPKKVRDALFDWVKIDRGDMEKVPAGVRLAPSRVRVGDVQPMLDMLDLDVETEADALATTRWRQEQLAACGPVGRIAMGRPDESVLAVYLLDRESRRAQQAQLDTNIAQAREQRRAAVAHTHHMERVLSAAPQEAPRGAAATGGGGGGAGGGVPDVPWWASVEPPFDPEFDAVVMLDGGDAVDYGRADIAGGSPVPAMGHLDQPATPQAPEAPATPSPATPAPEVGHLDQPAVPEVSEVPAGGQVEPASDALPIDVPAPTPTQPSPPPTGTDDDADEMELWDKPHLRAAKERARRAKFEEQQAAKQARGGAAGQQEGLPGTKTAAKRRTAADKKAAAGETWEVARRKTLAKQIVEMAQQHPDLDPFAVPKNVATVRRRLNNTLDEMIAQKQKYDDTFIRDVVWDAVQANGTVGVSFGQVKYTMTKTGKDDRWWGLEGGSRRDLTDADRAQYQDEVKAQQAGMMAAWEECARRRGLL